MREETIARIALLPCFVRRALGRLDPDHKLLLLQLALRSDDGKTVYLGPASARALRTQTSFTPGRFASALRRLVRGGFVEIEGAVTTDTFIVYLTPAKKGSKK